MKYVCARVFAPVWVWCKHQVWRWRCVGSAHKRYIWHTPIQAREQVQGIETAMRMRKKNKKWGKKSKKKNQSGKMKSWLPQSSASLPWKSDRPRRGRCCAFSLRSFSPNGELSWRSPVRQVGRILRNQLSCRIKTMGDDEYVMGYGMAVSAFSWCPSWPFTIVSQCLSTRTIRTKCQLIFQAARAGFRNL